MKKVILLPIIIFLSACGADLTNDPKAILKKANEKCLGVQNGYYEMTKTMKWMTEKDTVRSNYACHFKKLKGDTLFGKVFHLRFLSNGVYNAGDLYTGNELVTTNSQDSSAEIILRKKDAAEIAGYALGYQFYKPFTDATGLALAQDSDFKKPLNVYKLIAEEKLNNIPAYHIQVNEMQINDSLSDNQTLRIETHYWISKTDFIPLQYSIAYDCIFEKDTLYQYEKFVLNKYELNDLKDETHFQLSAIPSFYNRKDFLPYVAPLLLPLDTIAPGWELLSVNDEKISLRDLKGKLVLLDFFYQGCGPCRKALPMLQALSEKYKGKGLSVVGIDPNDTKEDDIAGFLSKHGVTYTVLLGAESVVNKYRVTGYPTMYLISRKGKVIATDVGYGDESGAQLEEVIKKNL